VFNRNHTVFVLGAGASWHYGYPTGADLVRKVLDKAEIVRSFCDQAVRSPAPSAVVHFPKYLSDDASGTAPSDGLRGIQGLWDRGRSEAEEFISRLSSVDPPKIRFPSVLTPRPRPNPLAHEGVQLFQDYKASLDIMYEASRGLLTIAPSEKSVSGEVGAAREALRKANCVYMLGYGFDENNSNLLELPTTLKLNEGSGKVVVFTNFRDINLVNKNASRVFFGRNDQLLSGEATIVGEATGDYLLEKSVRDVYGALALDFDSPEEHLTSSTPI
jgi:hypothetical protein